MSEGIPGFSQRNSAGHWQGLDVDFCRAVDAAMARDGEKSANIVAVGISAHAGEPVSFLRFVRYGLPITLAQLTLGALYVVALSYFSG